MSIDVSSWFEGCDDLAERAVNELARGIQGAAILKIASEITGLQERGVEIANFTVGDFSPDCFSTPHGLNSRIKNHLDAGNTNYPPAVGIPELRAAVRGYYARELGLDYPDGCVQIGAGARPPLYSAFATLVAPGDTVLYPVPSWNNHYYVYLNRAEGIAIPTKAENGFLPTAEDLAPHLKSARLICLNSPLNPAGTVIGKQQLKDICEAIVDENHRRRAIGDRPLMLLYDQVYWKLVYGEARHYTPVGLVPEMARYTVFIDAVSKCWAATGLRVGWAVVPPWVRDRMKPLMGHIGAWAVRPIQHATAELLDAPDEVGEYLTGFRYNLFSRLEHLRNGLLDMKLEGLPVDALEAQGAMYLTVRFDLIGKNALDGSPIVTDDDVRRVLLDGARVGVVPFKAFGLPSDTGWTRFSVGAVGKSDIDGALERIRSLLRKLDDRASRIAS